MEKNDNSNTQRSLERKSYEALIHTWVNEHDYYVTAEYRNFDRGNRGMLGSIHVAMLAGMNMFNKDEDHNED